MKIGIMTLWETEHNYGAILQCYALQEYLRKKGHDPFLIRYKEVIKRKNYKNITPAKICRFISKKMKEQIRDRNVVDEPRYFGHFIRDYMTQTDDVYLSYEKLRDNPPEADMYIVGSDQVWNFYETPVSVCKGKIHAYFLDFGKEQTKRASYAASWDEKYIQEEHLKEINPLIKKFDYVSVREKSGLDLCYRCGVYEAEWLSDPTLLLSADEYRKIYLDSKNNVRKISEPYLMLYMVMTQKVSFDISYVYNFARKKNLRVIYVAEDKTHDPYEKYYPTIPEWLYLMDNADYVVTNSFHGTVFSLLFHKQFATIPLKGYSSATNIRIKSLCELFQTKDRFVEDGDLAILDRPYHTDFRMPENHFEDILGGAKRRVLLKACTNGNLGDDLFVRVILDRYKNQNILFYLLVYDVDMYKYLLEEYPSLILVKYPVPSFFLRILAKAQEIIWNKHGIKRYGYERAYSALNKEKFDTLINIGGSQFAEYQGEQFILPLFIEEYISGKVDIQNKFLLNINYGPSVTDIFYKRCKALYKTYTGVTFRDKQSYELFLELNNVRYVPDIVFNYDFAKYDEYKQIANDIVCVNVINLKSNKRTYEERKNLIEHYESTVKAVIESVMDVGMNVAVVGFSMDIQERAYIDELVLWARQKNSACKVHKIIYNGKNLPDIIKTIYGCRSMLSTRFHAMILGMAMEKPQYPICYDHKLSNFLLSVRYEEPYSTLDHIESVDKITSHLLNGEVREGKYDNIVLESKKHFEDLDQLLM